MRKRRPPSRKQPAYRVRDRHSLASRAEGRAVAGRDGGKRRTRRRHGDRKSGSQDVTPKLADLGVTKTQSSRWQKLGSLDDSDFQARTDTPKKHAISSVEVTTARTNVKSGTARGELLEEDDGTW